jgi:two-component system cell cycle sensor histidine kinase/response regulator CckA
MEPSARPTLIQELLRSDEMWRALAENPFDYVMLADRTGTYLYINHVAPGVREEDFVGKATLFDYVAEEDRPEVKRALHTVFEQGKPYYYEVRTPFNGAWYATVMAPVFREGRVVAASLMSRDCTLQKRAEQASRQADARYKMIVESTRDGIWMLDENARTSFVSGRMAEMLGYTPEEMLGRGVLEFIHESRRALAQEKLEQRRQGHDDLHDFCFQRKDGSELWTLVSASPTHDAEGRVNGALAIITDQTERRHWAEEVAQAQKMEAVGRLAGGVAHEFNNLLASIIGFGSLLERSLDPRSKARSDVGHILEAADRASGLVRQLLTFARKQPVHARDVDLNAVLTRVLPMLRSLMPDDVSLKLELVEEPLHVCVDPGQMEQVILNLVINARDAIAAGGSIVLRVAREPTPVGSVSELGAGSQIALSVRDTGAGIPSSVLEHIFEPFFTTKGPDRGTGLGLSIVYSIVKQNGGSVHVESELGTGTQFILRFPEVQEASESVESAPALDLPTGDETVLLVEDDPLVRTSTRRMLLALGYRVLVAENGRAALELSLGDVHLDAVISDVVMPELSGPDMVQELLKAHDDLCVLFLSGHSEAMRLERGVGAQFPVLEKPFTLARLSRAVRSVLDAKAL